MHSASFVAFPAWWLGWMLVWACGSFPASEAGRTTGPGWRGCNFISTHSLVFNLLTFLQRIHLYDLRYAKLLRIRRTIMSIAMSGHWARLQPRTSLLEAVPLL